MQSQRVSILSLFPAVLLVADVVFLAACTSEEPSRRTPSAGALDDRLAYSDVSTLQELMESGDLTAVELVAYCMDRLAEIDRSGPRLHSILEVNPDAEAIAVALDEERRTKGPRGPLHGIPVVIKGNIDTGDSMATTAGSLALEGHRAPDDAFLVEGLREAGAVILGKANLSEWAFFRAASRPSSGWSSLGGQVRNPYVLDRNPSGSSSGSAVAVAAGLAPLAVGTETFGSILSPSSVNGVVGIKPTVGLVSRDGIIPISHTYDTAGPMARSVRDAALLLSAMAVSDAGDPAAKAHPGPRDYSASLTGDALAGARIGVWRSHYGSSSAPRVMALVDEVADELEAAGATVVDPVDLILPDGWYGALREVLLYELKHDLERYLQTSGVDPSVDTLAELIEFNKSHAEKVMPWFGQGTFEAAVEKGPLTESEYAEALEVSLVALRRAVDVAFDRAQLDAIIAATNGPAWPTDYVYGDRIALGSALATGYPAINLKMGAIHGLPVGLTVFGPPWSEERLIGYAYALESRLDTWTPPRFVPTLEGELAVDRASPQGSPG